ncbi:MAG: hypothetical protein KJP06_07815 [Deltaproteobacteria bacterium]|nr:hypothetical protein [Deltaproteobacteria bacterium]
MLGEKQMGRFVGFGSYTYNTAKGGAFGARLARHLTTAGLAVLKPFGLRGEIGLGTTWAQPFDNDFRSQYGVEGYWKLLMHKYWINITLISCWLCVAGPPNDFQDPQ